MQKIAYLMFGPQGSGKSTQGQILAEKLELPFFDTGHELRQVAKSHSPLAKSIAKSMKLGELVGNDTLETVMSQFFAKHPIEQGIVMDGFPRTIDEVKLFEKLVNRYNWRVIAVFITIADETIINRITLRAKTQKRSDDQPHIIAERLEIFKNETLPVVEYLKKHYKLLEVDGEPTPTEVTETMLEALKLND